MRSTRHPRAGTSQRGHLPFTSEVAEHLLPGKPEAGRGPLSQGREWHTTARISPALATLGSLAHRLKKVG